MLTLGTLGLRSFMTVYDGSPACSFPLADHERSVVLIEQHGVSMRRSYDWVLEDKDVRGDVPVARRRDGIIGDREYETMAPRPVMEAWYEAKYQASRDARLVRERDAARGDA